MIDLASGEQRLLINRSKAALRGSNVNVLELADNLVYGTSQFLIDRSRAIVNAL